MKNRIFSVLSLGAVLACADVTAPVPPQLPTAPSLATVERSHEVLPLDQIVNNTCSGELVRVTGNLHVFDQVVTMADGEIRTTFHTNFQKVVAVGQTSGLTYRAASAETATWQGLPPGPPGGPWRTSHEGMLHLVAPREGTSFRLHIVFIVTKEPGSPPQLIVAKNEVTCH